MKQPLLPQEPLRTLSATDLVLDLNKVRAGVRPDLRVVIDALSYCVVGVEHLLLHAHDEELEEN